MPSAASAGVRPVALVTSAGSAMTDPLLKMMCHSRPRSWIAASTWCSNGSTVATMEWPIETGTPSCLSRSMKARGGAGGMTWVWGGGGSERAAPFSATIRSNIAGCGNTLKRSSQLPAGDHDQPETAGAGASKRVERWLIDDAVVGDGAVVVGRERFESHRRPGQPSTLSAARTPRTIASAITSAASEPSVVSAISVA